MKPNKLLPVRSSAGDLFVRMIGFQIIVSSASMAAQFTWDTDSGTSGAQDGGGTWGAGNSFWNGSSNAAWPNTTTPNPDEAIFGNGGTAGTVTVSGNKNINKLTFNAVASGSYVLSGTGRLDFSGTSPGITSNASASITAPMQSNVSGTMSFTSNSGILTLSFSKLTRSGPGTRTFALGGAGDGSWTTGIINPHSDAPVSLTKSGTGTWTLSGFNGYTGVTTISEGVLSTDRIGDPTSAVNLGTGLTLTTTASSSTVTVIAGNTSSLAVGQTVYNINIPGGRTIDSITDAQHFVLSSGTGVLGGTAQPAVFGEPSGLGLATAAAGNLVFNGTSGSGVLQYTGTTKDTARAFTINTGKVATIEVTNSNTNLTFVGATGASTTGALTKTGAGTLTLSGTNTYSGVTTISGGTLALSGSASIANSSTIHLGTAGAIFNVTNLSGNFTSGAAQTVGGVGMILATAKTVTLNGTLSPGNSPGTLTQDGGTLQLGANGNLNWQIHDASGVAGTGYDTTSLANGATLDLSLLSSSNPYNINLWSLSAISPDANGNAINFDNTQNYTWTLFSTDTAITGFNSNLFSIIAAANNGTSGFSNALGGGSFGVALANSDTDLVLSFTAVPEPNLGALLGGLGTLALLRRRR